MRTSVQQLEEGVNPAVSRSQLPELFGGINLREYLQIAQRRKWWIIIPTVLLFLTALVVALTLPNIYRAETLILVEPAKIATNVIGPSYNPSLIDRLGSIQQQVMSQTILKRLIDTTGVYPELKGKLSDFEITEKIKKAITVDVVQPPGMRFNAFRIAFQGRSPVIVANVANQLAAMFIEENLKTREQQFYGTTEFLDAELARTRKEIEDKESTLRALKSQYTLEDPQSRQYHLDALNNLRSQLQNVEDRAARNRQEKAYLESLIASTAPTVDLDETANSPYRVQIEKLVGKLAELRSRYGSNFPDVRELQRQIDELKTKEALEEKSAPPSVERTTPNVQNPVLEARLHNLEEEMQNDAKTEANLQQQISLHSSKLQQIPVVDQRMTDLMRDYDSLRAHYTNLLNSKLNEETATEVEARQKGERFVIMDPAQIPETPAGPKRLVIAFAGLVGGLLGGVGLVVVLELADQTVRTETQVVEILKIPVLVGVPSITTRKQRNLARLRIAAMLVLACLLSVPLGLVITFLEKRAM